MSVAFRRSSKKASEERPESVQTMSTGVQSVRKSRTHQDSTATEWMELFPEVEKTERHRPQKRGLMTIVVAGSVLCVLSGQDPSLCIASALVAMAALVAFDAGHMFGRILADHSRYVLTAVMLTWTVFLVKPVLHTLIAAAIVSVLAIILIWTCNVRWMLAQVTRRTPAIKRMLNKNLPVDLERMRPTAIRMCNTLSWELGRQVIGKRSAADQELIIDSWMMGYSVGLDMQKSTVQANSRLTKENEELQAQVEAWASQIEAAQEYLKEYEAYIAEKEALEDDLAKARETIAERRRLEREAILKASNLESRLTKTAEELDATRSRLASAKSDLAAMTSRLQAADAELVTLREQAVQTEEQAADDKISVIAELTETPKERQDRLLREAASKGMSVRQAADYAGCSKSKADTFLRQLRQAADDQRELQAAQA